MLGKIKSVLKIIIVGILALAGVFSLIMSPMLIGADDPETSNIGLFYLIVFLTLSPLVYILIRKDLKPKTI